MSPFDSKSYRNNADKNTCWLNNSGGFTKNRLAVINIELARFLACFRSGLFLLLEMSQTGLAGQKVKVSGRRRKGILCASCLNSYDANENSL